MPMTYALPFQETLESSAPDPIGITPDGVPVRPTRTAATLPSSPLTHVTSEPSPFDAIEEDEIVMDPSKRGTEGRKTMTSFLSILVTSTPWIRSNPKSRLRVVATTK